LDVAELRRLKATHEDVVFDQCLIYVVFVSQLLHRRCRWLRLLHCIGGCSQVCRRINDGVKQRDMGWRGQVARYWMIVQALDFLRLSRLASLANSRRELRLTQPYYGRRGFCSICSGRGA